MSAWRYALIVLHHKWLVLKYGLVVGGIPLRQLLIHDLSKFGPAEFGPYRMRSVTGKNTPEYQAAWKHHWSRNPHHWEYWVRDGVATPMPEVYVREMLADWHAANRIYDTEPLQEWLNNRWHRINLHAESVRILRPIALRMGLIVP